MTLNEVFDKTLESHWGASRFEESGWRDELKRLFSKRIAPSFGREKITDIRLAALRQWFSSMRKTPTEANQALAVLSKVFNYAQEQEIVEYNPCKLLKRNVIKKRSMLPSPGQIKMIMEQLKADIHVHLDPRALFIMALVYTGSRPLALQKARWKDLVMNAAEGHATYTFHGKGSSDSGENEVVILPATLMQLIYEKFDTRGRLDDLVFPYSNYNNYWVKLRAQLGIEKMWARDLRRAFASIGLNEGFSMDEIGGTLNHKCTSTTKTYAKIFDEKKVEVVSRVADHLDALFD